MSGSIREKRRHPRVDVAISLRTTDPIKPSDKQMTNISESGIFIQTSKPYPIGSVIGLELAVDGVKEEPLFLKGRVVRIQPANDDQPAGMGVEFIAVPPRELARLRRIVWGASGGSASIILLTSDWHLDEMMFALLVEKGHQVIRARGLSDVTTAARENKVDLIVLDLADETCGFDELKSSAFDLPLVVICDQIDPELRAKAATFGIFELLEKPVDADQLVSAISREIQFAKLQRASKAEIYSPLASGVPLVARSKSMQEVVRQMMALAHLPQSVLITGETGSGKEVIARALHAVSNRRTRKFEVADCTMMDKHLMVSQLFGHEKGAFTGAESSHDGLVHQAADGFLFLDEIGELSLDGQAKLLRLLESGTYRRLGGNQDLNCKARIIAATNRNLRAMVQQKEFRQDLLYRLQVHTIHLPPLRDRKEDLVPLAHQLLSELNVECKTSVTSFSSKALQQLVQNPWTGNVRELRNVIAASLVGIEDYTLPRLKIQSDHLLDTAGPFGESEPGAAACDPAANGDKTWKEFQEIVREKERKYLINLLESFEGVVSKAAEHAGMTRQNLSKKLKEHGISPSNRKNK